MNRLSRFLIALIDDRDSRKAWTTLDPIGSNVGENLTDGTVIRLVALEPLSIYSARFFFFFFSFFPSRPVSENLVFVIFICHGRCDSAPDDPDSSYFDDFKRCNIDEKKKKEKKRKEKKKEKENEKKIMEKFSLNNTIIR